jgi:hypothetical protein
MSVGKCKVPRKLHCEVIMCRNRIGILANPFSHTTRSAATCPPVATAVIQDGCDGRALSTRLPDSSRVSAMYGRSTNSLSSQWSNIRSDHCSGGCLTRCVHRRKYTLEARVWRKADNPASQIPRSERSGRRC